MKYFLNLLDYTNYQKYDRRSQRAGSVGEDFYCHEPTGLSLSSKVEVEGRNWRHKAVPWLSLTCRGSHACIVHWCTPSNSNLNYIRREHWPSLLSADIYAQAFAPVFTGFMWLAEERNFLVLALGWFLIVPLSSPPEWWRDVCQQSLCCLFRSYFTRIQPCASQKDNLTPWLSVAILLVNLALDLYICSAYLCILEY